MPAFVHACAISEPRKSVNFNSGKLGAGLQSFFCSHRKPTMRGATVLESSTKPCVFGGMSSRRELRHDLVEDSKTVAP